MTTQTTPETARPGNPHANRRQVLYWRLLARLFDHEEQPALERASLAVLTDIGLPAALLDPATSIDTVVQRFPELADELPGLMAAENLGPAEPGAGPGPAEVRRAALVSKLLLNVFGTGDGEVTAAGLARWQQDAGWLERAVGRAPGELRAHPRRGELGEVLAGLEGELVQRMHLREVLADPRLARRLTPSISLVEQLLRDKANLSGVALANAKALIRRYVDEVAQVLAPRWRRPASARSTARCRPSGSSATSTCAARSGRTSSTTARRTGGSTSTGSTSAKPPAVPPRRG